MAAADYYNTHPPGTPVGVPRPSFYANTTSQQNVRPRPTPHQARLYSGSSHLSPHDVAPPAYSSYGAMESSDQKLSVPTADPNRYRSSSNPSRPHVAFPNPPSNPFTPQQFTPSAQDPRAQHYFPTQIPQQAPPQYSLQPYQPQGPYLQPQQYQPHGQLQGERPTMSSASLNSSHDGYSSDPEASRHHHHHRRRRRSVETRDRGNNRTTDSLIGAAGGGLIGDLIFPGLGTVGGALAGWVGGRDYAKHKERQAEEQREWDKRFRKGSYSKERPRY